MKIAYFDEAGDDGYPTDNNSPLFALSCIYFHFSNWQKIKTELIQTRRVLKEVYGFPLGTELHTRDFLLNKNPYAQYLQMRDERRIEVIDLLIELISVLGFRVINVVINKRKITSESYNVLHTALTYSIQRIENDLKKTNDASNFMIITDKGRVEKMRMVTRQIQKINLVPSKYTNEPYRCEIKRLIEDPLPQDSKESYFIQTADLISFIVYHYKRTQLGIDSFPRRMPAQINEQKILSWMQKLLPILNLHASESDPFGVVCYPK